MRILSLSGFIPEQICDTVRFTQYEGDYSISHFCGYVSDYISQVLNDQEIDGAVFPRSCDSSRIITGYLADCEKFIHQIPVPACAGDGAVRYLAYHVRQYHKAVEQYYGGLSGDIGQRVVQVNKRNEQIRVLYEKLGNSVSFRSYLGMIHELLKKPLAEQVVPSGLGVCSVNGKRVYLTGSFLSDLTLVDAMEASGLCIVGDNLTESKRLFSAPPVQDGKDLYTEIAKSMLSNKLSPTQNRFSSILSDDLEEIKKKEIQGVIFISQKYCEAYGYLYSVYKKMLDENRIPVLKLEVADSTDHRHYEFMLEAFADRL